MTRKQGNMANSPNRKKELDTFSAIVVVLIYVMGSACSQITPPTFIVWEESQFTLNRMVLDQSTGNIYLGGKDRLWKLNKDLNVLETIVTGPVEDDAETCIAPFGGTTRVCIEGREGTSVHNYNKILAFDPGHRILIACGSVYQGTCQVRSTNKQSLEDEVVYYNSSRSYYLAANTRDASTVAFIAPGPPNPEVTNVLYVGTSYSGYYDERNYVPAVSSRQLTAGPDRLEYASYDTKTEFGTLIELANRETFEEYPIQYVTGFNDTGYSYFLTIQKDRDESGNPTNNYISKIIQICHSDVTYSSYIEIGLECRSSSDNSRYNLVQSATIGTPGVDLAAKFGISSDKKILIASFARGQADPNNNVPQENTAICVYKMTDIRRKFLDNIEACYRGRNRLAKHFTPQTCLELAQGPVSDDYCGIENEDLLGYNHPIDGSMPVSAQTIRESSGYRVTAIATEVINDDTVAFLGTSNGHIKKMLVYDTSATEYNTIQLSDFASAIQQDMSFDASHEHLYAITEKMVYRIRVSECDKFTTCNECKQSQDPYCGWCSLENRY